MRILVTGANGFLGRHLVPLLKINYQVSAVSSVDYDLTDLNATQRCILETQPEIIFHLAGLSGGIGANLERPSRFYFVNTLLIANMFEAASRARVQHLVVPMGGCSYPASAKSPISEDQMWDGFPHGASSAYSSAKKMAIVASQAYSKDGLRSSILVPGNMYGEFDNYSLEDSHVIPAIIRKVYEAKMNSNPEIVMWGEGKPVRDFVYASDVAKVLANFVNHPEISGPINISTGTSVSIREVTEKIVKLMNFTGEVIWDSSKPEGQLVKIFDTRQLSNLGFHCETQLEDGLKNTISWFADNYQIPGAIRL